MIRYNGEATRNRILSYLRYRSKVRMPPTIREIGEAVGLSSSSTVYNHLIRLAKEKKITYIHGYSRSIEIIRSEQESCSCCQGTGWSTPREFEIPELRTSESTSFGV